MFAFIFRRFFQAVIVMCVLSLIGFSAQMAFGDPTRAMLAESASVQEREALRTELGLNDPFLVQWGRFVKNAVHGDFGYSLEYQTSAMDVIVEKAPATLELVFVASILIILISVPVGIFTACYPRNFFSRLLMGVSTIGVSIPVFLTAIGLMYFFSIYLDWLPPSGQGKPIVYFGFWASSLTTWENFQYMILPAASLASIMLPLFIRLIRAEMTETLQTDYVSYARAKGLHPFRIVMVHAFKNTLLPVITVGGVQIGTMIAFTILTETVFQWPGLGLMFIHALSRPDTPLIIAYLIVCGAIFVCVNTVVDLIYGFINPTVRIAGRK